MPLYLFSDRCVSYDAAPVCKKYGKNGNLFPLLISARSALSTQKSTEYQEYEGTRPNPFGCTCRAAVIYIPRIFGSSNAALTPFGENAFAIGTCTTSTCMILANVSRLFVAVWAVSISANVPVDIRLVWFYRRQYISRPE